MNQVPHEDLLGELLELADQIGLEVRRAPLGGTGGGLANLRGRQLLVIDTDASADIQLEKTAAGLSKLAARLDAVYIKPAIRALLEDK